MKSPRQAVADLFFEALANIGVTPTPSFHTKSGELAKGFLYRPDLMATPRRLNTLITEGPDLGVVFMSILEEITPIED